MTKVIRVSLDRLRAISLRNFAGWSCSHRLKEAMIVFVGFVAAISIPLGSAQAQQNPIHLNPAVEKLARGAVKKAEGRVLPALPSLWSFAAGLPKARPQRARHSALTDWTVQVVPTLP